MATSNTLALKDILNSLSNMSVEDLALLNKNVVAHIKIKQRAKQVNVGVTFRIGQLVRFDAKRKGIKYLHIEKFNRAGTCVVGYETDAQGSALPNKVRWTVANSFCTAI